MNQTLLIKYARDHIDNLDVAEAARISGFSEEDARQIIRSAFPFAFKKTKCEKLVEYARDHLDNLDPNEAAKAAGCSSSYARMIFQAQFPDAWKKREESLAQALSEYARTHDVDPAAAAKAAGCSEGYAWAFYHMRPDSRRAKLEEYAKTHVDNFDPAEAARVSGYSLREARRYFKRYYSDAWKERQKGPDPRLAKLDEYVKTHLDNLDAVEAARVSGFSVSHTRWILRTTYYDAWKERQQKRDPRLDKLLEYARDHLDNLDPAEGARVSGYSVESARRLFVQYYPDAWKERCTAKKQKLLDYVRSHPDFKLVEAVEATGYHWKTIVDIVSKEFPDRFCPTLHDDKITELLRIVDERGVFEPETIDLPMSLGAMERAIRSCRPKLWDQYQSRGIAAYKEAGRPPHVRCAVEELCPNGAGSVSVRLACANDPYFNSEASNFLTRFYNRRANVGRPTPTIDECQRALELREELCRFDDLDSAVAAGCDATEAADVAAAANLFDFDEILEKRCCAPPPEYLEDVLARGRLGVKLPKECFDRYYELYLRNKKRGWSGGRPFSYGIGD